MTQVRKPTSSSFQLISSMESVSAVAGGGVERHYIGSETSNDFITACKGTKPT
jgi:hypothetical protein